MELFERFWWLLFPVMGMIYGLIIQLQKGRSQARALDVLKTYAEQGKDPPPEVLKALSQTDLPAGAEAYAGGPATSAWWTFFVFLALTAGFGFGYSQIGGSGQWAFALVAIVMGVLALGSFIMAAAATFRRRP
jgi:hypothetical protein